ncbi:hypothetical protein NKR23_g869 [Pleurostoma richardsiae]|uniref:Uncharacterized protein n=1 Tax=Pleurostoma richardsiae TaxID=41990 RepID=A0AA38RSR7_9PEZI|nr:hypothetical protein NKR23_g869 [Pleurostoma richardsiae]
MDEESDDAGFLAIALSDSEDAAEEPQKQRKDDSAGQSRSGRTAQSEEEFQAVRREYQAKVENGEIWSAIKFPLGRDVPKMVAQEVLHAVEELYFFRRFGEARDFIARVDEDADGLDGDTRAALGVYRAKVRRKLGEQP